MDKAQSIREIRKFADANNLCFKLAMKFMIKHKCKTFDEADSKYKQYLFGNSPKTPREFALKTFDTPMAEADEADAAAAPEAEMFELPGDNTDRLYWLRDVDTTQYTKRFTDALLTDDELAILEGLLIGDVHNDPTVSDDEREIMRASAAPGAGEWFQVKIPSYGDCFFLCILQALHDSGNTRIKTVLDLKAEMVKWIDDNKDYPLPPLDENAPDREREEHNGTREYFRSELRDELESPNAFGDGGNMSKLIANMFNVCIYIVDVIGNRVDPQPFCPEKVDCKNSPCPKIFLYRYNHLCEGQPMAHFDLLIPRNSDVRPYVWPPQIVDDIDDVVFTKYEQLWRALWAEEERRLQHLRQLFDEIALKSASRADLYQSLVNMLQSQKDRIDGRPGGFRFGGPPPGGFGFGGPPRGPPPGGFGFGGPPLGPPRGPPPGHGANLRTAASHDASMAAAAVWDAEQAKFAHVAQDLGLPYARRIHQQAQNSSYTYDADVERAIQASLQDAQNAQNGQNAQNAQNGQGRKINTSKFQRKTRSKNNKKIFKKISINRKK